jgi:hypothetical protein
MDLMSYIEAAAFLVVGLVNLTGRPLLRPADGQFYPVSFYRALGSTELAVALFLVSAQTRAWAVTVGGLIAFFSIVNLLKHSRYGWSVPPILILVAMVPVSMLHG